MAAEKWGTPESAFSCGLGTGAWSATSTQSGMSGMTNTNRAISSGTVGSQIISGVIQNATDKFTRAFITLYLTHGSNIFGATPGGGSYFNFYAIYNVDGTIFEADPTVLPTGEQFLGSCGVPATATQTSYRRGVAVDIEPYDFKLIVQNNTGLTLGSSLTNAVVNMRRYNREIV